MVVLDAKGNGSWSMVFEMLLQAASNSCGFQGGGERFVCFIPCCFWWEQIIFGYVWIFLETSLYLAAS